jgi:hypothetical protein
MRVMTHRARGLQGPSGHRGYTSVSPEIRHAPRAITLTGAPHREAFPQPSGHGHGVALWVVGNIVLFGHVPFSGRVDAGMLSEMLSSAITLTNGLTIECFPCTLRSLRGWTIPVGVLDELAFFRLEGQADSDVEVQASLRRAMLGFPAPRLVKISTPYMRSGVLWDDFRKGWEQDNPDLLVWRASTVLMDPSLRPASLERERRLDPDRFAREYEAEFTEDLETFLPGAWIDAAIGGRRASGGLPARTPGRAASWRHLPGHHHHPKRLDPDVPEGALLIV